MPEIACAGCGEVFEAATSRARYCSDSCRNSVNNAKRPRRDHGRTVGDGLRQLAAVVDEVDGDFVDPADVTEVVSKHISAVLNSPTEASARAYLTRITAEYQAAVAGDRIRHESELAAMRERLAGVGLERDQLVVERDALLDEARELRAECARLGSIAEAAEALSSQMASLRSLVQGERRMRSSRIARPVVRRVS